MKQIILVHTIPKLLLLVLTFSFSLAIGSAFAQVSPLAGIAPGTIKNSYIDLGESDSLALSIIRGRVDGPVFTIVAGIHGFEYPPIIAVQRILKSIDPKELKGSLLIIPLASEASFYQRSVFTHPEDGKNLNRVFPGNGSGTVTEKIAAFISQVIIPVTDVFLDIHGGDASEDLLPFVCFYDRKDASAQVALARKLASAADFEYNVIYPYTLKADQRSEYAFKEAVQQGKTALSIEAGKLGAADRVAIDRIENGILNMLKEMEMIQGSISTHSDQRWLVNPDYIKAPVQGIFYSDIKSGDQVSKGQYLGYITDIFGEKLEEIHSGFDGIVLYKIGTPPVNTGETMFCIGKEN